MSVKGGDYSVARPDPASLYNAGWRFVCRYLRDINPTNGDKSLSKDEADRLRNAGLTIVSNDETTADRGLAGYDAGVYDAGAAHAAHVRCGAPKARPIYFSPWDHDPALLSPAQKATVFGYLRGCAQVLGTERVGLYAGVDLVREAFDQHLIAYGWEAAGWRHGKPSDPRTAIIQHVTASWALPGTDANEAVKADYGQWDVITLADAATILTAIANLSNQISKFAERTHEETVLILHGDETHHVSLDSISDDTTATAKLAKSTDARLAVIESTLESASSTGVPVVLTDAQLIVLAGNVATELANRGIKLSGQIKGAIDGTVELGADA